MGLFKNNNFSSSTVLQPSPLIKALGFRYPPNRCQTPNSIYLLLFLSSIFFWCRDLSPVLGHAFHSPAVWWSGERQRHLTHSPLLISTSSRWPLSFRKSGHTDRTWGDSVFEQDSVFSHGCLSFHFILSFGVVDLLEMSLKRKWSWDDVFAWPLTFVLHLIRPLCQDIQ